MFRRALSAAVAAALLAAPVANAAEKAITFGVAAPYSKASAEESARLLEGYLGSALKRPVKAITFESYEAVGNALAKGEVDLAWITPLAYVNASKDTGVTPVAKALRKGMFYRAALFVRADSDAKDLAGLKGKSIAWVEQNSTSGYLFPRGMVLKAGNKLEGYFGAETLAGDHSAVCKAVLDGKSDVGATFAAETPGTEGEAPSGCTETLGKEIASKLRTVVLTDKIPNEVIAARPEFDEELAGQVASIFALASETESGRTILTKVFKADGFGLALEEDFDAIRSTVASVAAGKWIDAAKKPAKKRMGGDAEVLKPVKELKKDAEKAAKKKGK